MDNNSLALLALISVQDVASVWLFFKNVLKRNLVLFIDFSVLMCSGNPCIGMNTWEFLRNATVK